MYWLLGLLIAYIIYQVIELNTFSIKRINYTLENLPEDVSELDFVFLSDVHGYTYGNLFKQKSRLVRAIKTIAPKAIILGGDVVSKKHPEQYETMALLIKQLAEIAPVYYVFGNHESSLEISDEEGFNQYIDEVKKVGVQIVRNTVFYPFSTEKISCYGLELPLNLYQKGQSVEFPTEILDRIRQQWMDEGEKMLFVHQPSFAQQYAKLPVFAIFSGHTHGGLVRIPGIGSLISTELTWWPQYDGGTYQIGENKDVQLVVSQGLGTHHFHIRIFDRAQLIYGRITSCKKTGNIV